MNALDIRTRQENLLYNPNLLIEVLVVFCIMCRLGFPGNLAIVFGGEPVRSAIDYGASLVQLLVMLMSSGDTLMDIKLIDLKRKYVPVYLMLAFMFVMSMLVAWDRGKQLTIILRFSVTALFGLWLADRFDSEHLLELVYFAQLGIIASNFLCFTVFRNAGYHIDEGYGYIFRGLYAQKNGLGSEFAWGILLQIELLRVKRRRGHPLFRFFWGALGAQVFFLLISRSTTALFCCGAALAYLILYDRRGENAHRYQWGILYTAVSIGFLFMALTIMPLFAPLLEAIGKDATLTGRVPMWRGIIDFLQEHNTFTGFGLLQFWETPPALKDLHSYFPRDSWFRSMEYGAHSVLLETWLDLGLFGLSSYYITLIHCFRRVKKLTSEQYSLCSVIMILTLIGGLTDRIFSNVNYNSMFFFVMLGVACGWPRPEPERSRHRRENMIAEEQSA